MYNYDVKCKSVEHLLDFLNAIISSPHAYLDSPASLVLHRQSTLANFSNEELGIFSTSLNSLKSHAQRFLPGGFSQLESARLQAFEAITNVKRDKSAPVKSNKNDLILKIAALKESQQLLMQDLMLMSLLLEKAMHMASIYASMQPTELTLAICAKETAELYKSLAFRRVRVEA